MEKIENVGTDNMTPGFVLIRLWHPAKDLDFISTILSMPCLRSWTAGSPRQTPRGQSLSGTNSESYWCSEPLEFSVENGFVEKLAYAIDCLQCAENKIHDLRASGGRIEIYLQLPGSVNNGDTIRATHLKALGEMGVDLLVEVFPKTKSREPGSRVDF